MTIDMVPPGVALHSALIAVLAFCVSALILLGLLKTGLAWRLATDIPNERSLHARPTPRVGGWGIVPVTVVGMLAVAPRLWLVAACALFLSAVSQVDDRRGLPARIRFLAHAVAVATIVVAYPASVAWWVLAGLAVCMVWLINLYNFMDGADGLAGGMALFGFGAYAFGAILAPHASPELTFASIAVCGAAAGFLILNFHPAKIFLGDAGSIPLGFLAGGLGYWGWRDGVWPIWFPVMVFSPFIADASVTLARRLARGQKFWQAHREHYYQRMVRSGTGHAGTAVRWYIVMLAGALLALWALGRPAVTQYVVVIAWLGVLLIIGMAIDFRWSRFQSNISGDTAR